MSSPEIIPQLLKISHTMCCKQYVPEYSLFIDFRECFYEL